jgi:hypothetical protein
MLSVRFISHNQAFPNERSDVFSPKPASIFFADNYTIKNKLITLTEANLSK